MKINKLLKSTLSIISTSALAFTLASCGKKNYDEVTPELEGYKIAWSDEFNGTEIDSSIWTKEYHKPYWVNNEMQEYTKDDENGFIRDGKLVIKGIKNNFDYTSCRMNSCKKKDIKYGKIEVRAKVPEGQGLWPAIWLLSSEEKYGGWPQSGEIDIMEILCNDTTTTYANAHFGNPHGDKQGIYKLTDGDSFSKNYHVFGLEWEPGVLRYYIDGNLFHTIDDWYSTKNDYPAPFDQNFYVVLNMAIGGDWPGAPDDATADEYMKNAEFLVDYVRVYQKESYDENVQKKTPTFRSPDETGNYVTNGDFSTNEKLNDSEGWSFYENEGGTGSATISDNMITIETTETGREDYSIQLVQNGIVAEKGKTYKLSFDIWADEERTINEICVDGVNVNYTRYLTKVNVAIPTEKTTLSYTFTMNEKSDGAARLEFNMGKNSSTATIHITNIRYEEVK